jgi:uncharacterized phiE125 gp8 family phage protein
MMDGLALGWPDTGQPTLIRARAASRLITPPTLEPLTVDEGKLWAGFDWPAGDPREPLMATVIASARAHLEQETGRAFFTQTRDALFMPPDPIGDGRALVILPGRCHPVQQIVSLTWVDPTGMTQVIDPSWYAVDPGSGLLQLASGQSWPMAPVTVRVIAGWATVADLTAAEPRLMHLVGRLVAHNMTLARDVAVEVRGSVLEIPIGFADELQPYRQETLA